MGRYKRQSIRLKASIRKMVDEGIAMPTGASLPDAKNSGYADHGAAHNTPAFENFRSTSTSPQRDIYAALPTLRSRSRVLAISAPLVTSALRTLRTYVVGRGLHLHCMPDFEVLGMSREQAKTWAQNVEREFELWAADKNSVDVLGLADFYELQQLAYKSWKESGDAFVVFRDGGRNQLRPYSLRVQLLEADRVCSPFMTSAGMSVFDQSVTLPSGNKCYCGVEVDKLTGAIVAYHIASDYPQNGVNLKFERIEKLGKKTGMPNIIHLMDAERPEQLRGVPFVAPVIEPQLQLARYLNSEATAALFENYHSAYIKTPDSGKPILEQGVPGDDDEQQERDLSELEPQPGGVFQLNPGEDIVFNDPKRPGTQFAPFTEALAKYIGAALEIPGDVLMKSYNSSYSASRAALQDFWRKVEMERDWFAYDFCSTIFEQWLFEAVALGRVNAPGFFSDIRARRAWCKHQWNGSAMPHLDPVKEARALQIMVGHGWLTNEQATTQLNGGDWNANVADLEHEQERLGNIEHIFIDDNENGEQEK